MNNFSPNATPPRKRGNPIKFALSAIATLILVGGIVLGAYGAVMNADADAAARNAVWEEQGAWDATPVPAVADPNATGTPLPSLDPAGDNSALPTVRPDPDVLEHGFAIVPNDYFGPKAVVTYFPVNGRDANEVSASIDAQSPATFAGGTAFAWVVPVANFKVSSTSGSGFFGATSNCTVDPGQTDAVQMSYTVHLPLWEPPADADTELISWWNDEFSHTLAHEHHHIDLYDYVAQRMNQVIAAGGDCEAIKLQITAMWDEAILRNCQYDLDEYGLAAGATLDDCTGMGVKIGPKLLDIAVESEPAASPRRSS